jgi:uncharacterized protein YjiS (DUF1127 family)
MKPSDNRLLNDPIASIENPIRRAAIDICRLIGGPFQHLSVVVSKRLEQVAQRRHLQSLDDHMLKDIGISRCDVEREIRLGSLSHELYFRARQARAKAMADALGRIFANASRQIRRWSQMRDGNRPSR